MMPESLFPQISHKTLRLTLYSGIGLIVISMLFLGREVQTSSFLTQAALAVAMPAFFYPITGGTFLKGINVNGFVVFKILLDRKW